MDNSFRSINNVKLGTIQSDDQLVEFNLNKDHTSYDLDKMKKELKSIPMQAAKRVAITGERVRRLQDNLGDPFN